MSARHSGSEPPVSFELPAGPGTYILVLQLHWECVIDIGALGELTFPPGYWFYSGSALGPGGLAARIAHHARFAERPRWHVDYLRFAGTPLEVWYAMSDESHECDWAALLADMDGVERGPLGFGSSDCGCEGHLFHTERTDIFEKFHGLTSDVQRAPAVRPDG